MTLLPAHTPWLPFLEGLLLAGGCSLVGARWLGPKGWMDHPEGRKTHARPTPRTGGLAFLVALGVLQWLGILSLPLRPLQWAAVGIMGLLGCWDDRVRLSALPKAAVGLLVALVLSIDLARGLAGQGVELHFLGLSFPNHVWATAPMLTLWFWSIPQAFNLMDGLDGLALGFLALALYASGLGWAGGTAAFWGIWVAVFLLNYPKPLHFMGDAGALGLGMLMAILVIQGAIPEDGGLGLWVCAYLVVDVSAVVYGRWRDRRPLGCGDRTHLHHGIVEALGHRAWLGTPLLLALAALTTLRPRPEPWADRLAELGLLSLVGLAAFLFRQRARKETRQATTAPSSADGIGMKPPAVA